MQLIRATNSHVFLSGLEKLSNSSRNVILIIVTSIGVSEGLLTRPQKEFLSLMTTMECDSRPGDVSALAVS